ncbi:MAG: hypothetical protein K2W96_25840, partial [Gemmataceae bacterium]|nr:hypothetical protein [Gemmataceae bacterium]
AAYWLAVVAGIAREVATARAKARDEKGIGDARFLAAVLDSMNADFHGAKTPHAFRRSRTGASAR